MQRGLALVLLLATSGCARLLPARPEVAGAASAPQLAPAVGSDPRADVLSFARAQIGKPYCWGGAGPSCFDCSGLVESSWRRAGVLLPRTSEAMARQLREVSLLDARVGDILYWPGHVGLYAGDGQVIDAGATLHRIAERRVWGAPRVLRPTGT